MVQYGGGLPTGGSGGRNQRFRSLSSPRFNLRNVLLLLVVIFVLRNLLQNDYRSEEIQYLRESGITEEQIERIVPKIASGRERNDELEKMKKDIEYLMKEVENLKVGEGSLHGKTSVSDREGSLRSMDHLHEEKRRMNEEQLLRDHPDFKPSKRLKDSLGLQHETKSL